MRFFIRWCHIIIYYFTMFAAFVTFGMGILVLIPLSPLLGILWLADKVERFISARSDWESPIPLIYKD